MAAPTSPEGELSERRLGGADLVLLEAMFDPHRDAPMFVKDAALRYVAANLAMVRLCGAPRRAEVLGRRAADFFPSPLAKRYEALDREVLETGVACVDRLDLTLDRAGAPTWLLFSRLPVRDAENRMVGVAATARRLGTPEPRHPTYARLSAVVERMEADISAPFSLGELAGTAGLSRSQLERDFRATFGVTPRGYLQRLRLDRAIERLRAGHAVCEVAQACGYADQSAFTRRFKAAVGLTPSAFRRRVAPPADTTGPPAPPPAAD